MPDWIKSVRSLMALMITLTFCIIVCWGFYWGLVKIDGMMVHEVVILALGFYFVKNRPPIQ